MDYKGFNACNFDGYLMDIYVVNCGKIFIDKQDENPIFRCGNLSGILLDIIAGICMGNFKVNLRGKAW